MLFVYIALLSVISGILYWLGGRGKEWASQHGFPEWTCNTKVRDIGCAIVSTAAAMLVTEASWWQHALLFVGTFGSLTTYWDKICGKDSFATHGLVIGLCSIAYGNILIACTRGILLGVAMGITCWIAEKDYVEEGARGAYIPLSLLTHLLKGCL